MKKYKIFSLILIAFVFILGGCANIEYQRLVDDNGQILDKITIEIDNNKLIESGYGELGPDLVENIKADLNRYYIAPIKYRLQSLPLDEYFEMTKQIEIGTVLSSLESGVYKVSVEILFANSDVMAFVYGHEESDENEESSLIESKSFFINKYQQTSDNVFGDITTIDINGDNIYERYCSALPGYDSSDITLTQIYGSTNDRMHTNADEIIDYNGFTCHLWEFNGSDTSKQLLFYYLSPNSTGWYVLALVLTIFVTTVIIISYKTRKKYNTYKIKIDINKDTNGENNG